MVSLGDRAIAPLRVGLVGAGHFGRFHALKLAGSRRAMLRAIHDPVDARAHAVAREAGREVGREIAVLPLDRLLDAVDAVVVAAPAEHHYALARAALERGRHVLVEKPIASTLAEADHLASLAVTAGRVLQVGHLLRFSAEHRAIAERIDRPLYVEATRIAPFKPRGTDVSVILDLMIHDLDLVLSLIPSPIEAVDALGAAVSSAQEDIANARVRFANGAVAAITASRISLKTERRMRVFAADGYLSADFVARELTFINRTRGLPLPGTGGFRREAVRWQDEDQLAREHEAFAASCLDNTPVAVDAAAGRRALALALAVHAAIGASRARMEGSGLLPPARAEPSDATGSAT